MSVAEVALARHALKGAESCAKRLQRSQHALTTVFPLTSGALAEMEPSTEDALDAFLKRFEELVATVQDELFKAIAVLGGEDIRSLARREIAELMERLGALPSAATFRSLVAMRNRLTHTYPDEPERQARNLNEAFASVSDLLAA